MLPNNFALTASPVPAPTHIATHLVFVVLIVGSGHFQNQSKGFVVSTQIGMKFGKIVSEVDTHPLKEFDFGVVFSRRLFAKSL